MFSLSRESGVERVVYLVVARVLLVVSILTIFVYIFFIWINSVSVILILVSFMILTIIRFICFKRNFLFI